MQPEPITCKLLVHDKKFNTQDVILYKELPGLSIGDIIEVYHPDNEYSRLLVEVKQYPNEATGQQKGTVSIQQVLVSSFYLRQYYNVTVNKVNKKSVTLDLVEVIIKDTFLTRGDAWRFNRSMIGSCAYNNHKIDFCDTRITIKELWMGGVKVACGVVGETTKFVYRSASSKFHIFVQMSAEMWEFDYTGDLFFEKAIMFFLQDLFNMWKDKDMNCNHDVVIVLFSRTYYSAVSIDEFSSELQSKVLCAPDGRFYQDFYKVIRQSEKQDDLQNVILDLKRSFHGYPLHVNCRQPFSDPCNQNSNAKGLGENSRAAEGNWLEAINLSLNVFEKSHINSNLEEMNCTTLIITPSTGVFEVDEELTIITKNRLIDNGVNIDLVCLAEQPLHAVPLIKYISKSKTNNEDIYSVPEWINPSYYSKPQTKSSVFVPRIRVPERPHPRELKLQKNPPMFNDAVDFEEYDEKVFDYCKPKVRSQVSTLSTRSSITQIPYHTSLSHTASAVLDHTSVHSSPEVSKSFTAVTKKLSLQEDVPMMALLRSVSEEPSKSGTVGSFDDLKFTMESDKDDASKLSLDNLPAQQTTTESVSSASGLRTTFNPFKPQQMAKAITLFKHRWFHTFPEYVNSVSLMEQYGRSTSQDFPAFQSPSSDETRTGSNYDNSRDGGSSMNSALENTVLENKMTSTSDEEESGGGSFVSNCTIKSGTSVTEEWTASTFNGVDWKSLCLPPCLPLTIHYFPEETTLQNQYYENNYTMVMEPDEIGPDGEMIRKEVISISRFDRTALSPEKKFMEMISQRISKGFQMVTDPTAIRVLKLKETSLESMVFVADRSYVLSMGLTIHYMRLVDSEVHVTRYSLREPVIPKSVIYRYNVWPYNVLNYSPATTEFSYENPNHYNWNSVDRYICDTEKEYSQLTEPMKYWRTRFLLLPVKKTLVNDYVTAPNMSRFRTYMLQIEGFLRLLEGMNKIRRGPSTRLLFSGRKHNAHPYDRRKKSSEKRQQTPERKVSRTSLNDKRASPIQVESAENNKDSDASISRLSTPSNVPLEMPPEHSLSVKSSFEDIIKAMLNSEYGLTFIPKQENLREKTFISAEAVAWMIKCVDGCFTKNDAVALGERLLENKFILHASESSRQNFVDGFYLYFIKEDKKEDEQEKRRFWFSDTSKKTEEELLTSYNTQWLEVAVWRRHINKDCLTTFLQDSLPRDITYKRKERVDGAVYSDEEVPLYRKMEYNPDINRKSGRSEWCVIAYHGNYYPSVCAYAIELNWLVASGAIIADLVQKWSHKATSCGVHVVPAPMCVFPRHTIRCSRNPFRKSPFIPLNIECLLRPGQTQLFQDYDPSTWHHRMMFFQEAILYKFDFLRDIPQTSSDRIDKCQAFQYIHTSGSIFVKINDNLDKDDHHSPTSDEEKVFQSPFGNRRPTTSKNKSTSTPSDDKYTVADEHKNVHGFFWVYNYALTKKWRSNITGSVSVARQYMRETFSSFCDNKDNQLLEFWHDTCAEYERERQLINQNIN